MPDKTIAPESALTATTTRPVQKCGEIDSCFDIGLQSSSSPADQTDQEKDQEHEEQDLSDQCRSRGQHRETQHAADERDDQEHQCVIEHLPHLPLVYGQV